MTTLMAASNQWARRPDDERFTSLAELLSHAESRRAAATAKVTNNRTLSIAAARIDGAEIDVSPDAALDSKTTGLAIMVDDLYDRSPILPTHHAFNQVASLVGAPAGYLRKLHPALVADCLNFGIIKRGVEEVGLLGHAGEGAPELSAATGPNYGRIWNDEVIRAIIARFGDGVTGDFTVPGEFGKAVNVTKANTTLFAGDRDMFVFLADEKNRVPNPARGGDASLARGFFVWNSEVGSTTFGVSQFLFDYVCCNRIVWGAQQVQEVRIRHTSGAPQRFIEEIAPALELMAQSSTVELTDALTRARDRKLDDDVDEFLRARFTRGQVAGMKLAHEMEENRPIETVWDAVTAATAYAKNVGHQDDRVAIERAAGKMLAKA